MTIHFGGLSIRSLFFFNARHSFTQMAPPYIVWLKTHKAWHSFSLFDVLRTFVSCCFDLLDCCLAKMDDSEMGPVVLSLCSLVTPCAVYSLNFVLHQQLPLAVLSLNNHESQDEDAICRNKRFIEWMELMNVKNIFIKHLLLHIC